jgi:hypothetical protein
VNTQCAGGFRPKWRPNARHHSRPWPFIDTTNGQDTSEVKNELFRRTFRSIFLRYERFWALRQSQELNPNIAITSVLELEVDPHKSKVPITWARRTDHQLITKYGQTAESFVGG